MSNQNIPNPPAWRKPSEPIKRRLWSKFHWQDHRFDAGLSVCSLAARGLWLELLCIAHKGQPYWHVTMDGRAATPAEIAKIARTTRMQAVKLLSELEEWGVFSRTADGTIYSRRMVRDRAQVERR